MRTIRQVEVFFLAHATEDANRLLRAVSSALKIGEEGFSLQNAEGHFGNPLKLYKTVITGRGAEEYALTLFRILSNSDIERLESRLEKHMDEHGGLHLRIDKQSLFFDKVTFGQRDSVKVRIRPRYNSKDLITSYRRLIMGEDPTNPSSISPETREVAKG